MFDFFVFFNNDLQKKRYNVTDVNGGGDGQNINDFSQQSKNIVFFDETPHDGKYGFVFFDTHVEFLAGENWRDAANKNRCRLPDEEVLGEQDKKKNASVPCKKVQK